MPSHTHAIFRSLLCVAAQAAAEETAAVESAKVAIVGRNVKNLRRALQLPSLEAPSALRARVVHAVLKQLATSGWSEGTEAVLQMGVDVNSVDADGRTLLHHAAERGDCRTVDVLLARSCKVGARSTSGRTPLHEATYNGHLEVMRRLLQSKAPIDERDADGATPLVLAVELHREEAAELLVEHGAALAAKKNDGKSVLALAESQLGDRLKRIVAERSLEASLVHAKEAWISQNPSLRPSVLASTEGAGAGAYRFALPDVAPAAQRNIDRVRVGDWNVFNDTFFDSAGSPDPAVYKGLAFAESAGARSNTLQACTAADVQEQIDTYEHELTSAGAKCRANPLYYLLHARLAHLLGNEDQRVLLLRLLRQVAPDLANAIEGGGWLSPDEIRAVRDAEVRSETAVMRSGSNPPAPVEPVSSARAPADATRSQWETFKNKLSKKQQEPMERLLDMTGLEPVKQIALEVYRGVLADARLVNEGHSKAVGQRTLNYAFLGNPGTGKSTIGKLFAELLAASGARAGHKFIEMKASEAMRYAVGPLLCMRSHKTSSGLPCACRMGATAFANELASLTGGKKGVAPPPTELRRGMAVEVKMATSRAGAAASAGDEEGWFPATVLVCHDNGFVDVQYSNGEVSEKVDPKSFQKVRPMGSGEQVGGVLFLDEAYDLDPANNRVGADIFNEIMAAAEDHREKVVCLLQLDTSGCFCSDLL